LPKKQFVLLTTVVLARTWKCSYLVVYIKDKNKNSIIESDN